MKKVFLLFVGSTILSVIFNLGVSAKQPYSDKAGFPAELPKLEDIIQVYDPLDKSVLEGKIVFRKLQKEDFGQFKKGDVILYFSWDTNATVLYRNGQYFGSDGTKVVHVLNTERKN